MFITGINGTPAINPSHEFTEIAGVVDTGYKFIAGIYCCMVIQICQARHITLVCR
jgi:hypothetical protein